MVVLLLSQVASSLDEGGTVRGESSKSVEGNREGRTGGGKEENGCDEREREEEERRRNRGDGNRGYWSEREREREGDGGEWERGSDKVAKRKQGVG